MALAGKGDYEMLKALCAKPYKNQAIWFLNAFWHQLSGDAETFWAHSLKLASLDLQKGAEGNELDEMQMHRFLESFKETMTVTEIREALRSSGAIVGIVKMFPITHYYIFKYKIDWHKLVNASQGDNQKEIEAAQEKLNQVQAALKSCEVKKAESKSREIEAKAARVELEAAYKEVKALEDAFNAKTDELKKKSEEGSVVAQNKAKNELAQHLASDPLPLRKAKITQEAAVKKAERAVKAAAEASAAAEAALDDCQKKFEEAEAYLIEVKSKPGSAQGQLFWIERELKEAKFYLPEKRGGQKKN